MRYLFLINELFVTIRYAALLGATFLNYALALTGIVLLYVYFAPVWNTLSRYDFPDAKFSRTTDHSSTDRNELTLGVILDDESWIVWIWPPTEIVLLADIWNINVTKINTNY